MVPLSEAVRRVKKALLVVVKAEFVTVPTPLASVNVPMMIEENEEPVAPTVAPPVTDSVVVKSDFATPSPPESVTAAAVVLVASVVPENVWKLAP